MSSWPVWLEQKAEENVVFLLLITSHSSVCIGICYFILFNEAIAILCMIRKLCLHVKNLNLWEVKTVMSFNLYVGSKLIKKTKN